MTPIARSILKWSFLTLAVLVITVVLIYSLRHILISPYLAAWIEKQINTETGLTVDIGRIRGTYIDQIIVEDLVTRDSAPTNPLRRIDLKHFEATYSLPALLKGRAAFIRSLALYLNHADLFIDFRIASDTRQTDKSKPIVLPPPELLPRIRLQGGSLHLRTEGFVGKLEGLDADLVESQYDERQLKLTATTWQWDLVKVTHGAAPVSLNLSLTNDSIVVAPLTIGREALKVTARVALNEMPAALPFKVKLTVAGDPAEISGRLEKNFVQTQFHAKGLDLAALGDIASFEFGKAAGQLSFKGGVRVPLEDPARFDGNLILDLRNASYRYFKADHLQTDASAKSGSIQIHRLDFSHQNNKIEIQDLFLPSEWTVGNGDRRLLEGVVGSFQVDLQDVPSLLQVVGKTRKYFPSDPPAHRLRIDGDLKSKGIIKAGGDLFISENTLRMETSQIQIPLPGRRPDESRLDIRLQADFNHLGLLSRLFPIPEIGGRLKGDVAIGGTIGQPRGRIEFRGKDMVVNSMPLGNMVASISADGQQVRAQSFEITNGSDLLRLQGNYDVQQHALQNARFEIKIAEVKRYLDAWTVLPYSIQGDLQGIITADGPLTTPSGKLTSSSRRLQVDNTELSDLLLRMKSHNGELHIETANVKMMGTRLALSGSVRTNPGFEQFDATVDAFSLRREGLFLKMPQPAQILYAPRGNLNIDNFALEGTAGELRLEGQWEPKGSTEFQLQIARLKSMGWFSELVGRDIDFEGLNTHVHLKGTMSNPWIKLKGQVGALQIPYLPVPLAGSFDLSYEKNRLYIEAFDWHGEGGYQIIASGSAPIPCVGKHSSGAYPLSLTSNVQLPKIDFINELFEAQPIVAGSLEANLKMEGNWQAPVIDLQTSAQGVELGPDLGFSPTGPLKIRSRIRYRTASVFIDTLNIQSPFVNISGKGVWRDGFTPEMMCNPPTDRLPGEVSIDGTVQVSDLAWLSAKIPEIRRIEGKLDGDIKLHGPLQQPALSATVSVVDGVVRTQMDLPVLEEIQLEALVSPSLIEIRRLQGLLGGATFNLSGTIHEPMTQNPVADINLKGDNLLIFRDKGLRLRADTNLSLSGPLVQLVLSGDLAVTGGLFNRYIEWLGPLQGNRSPESTDGIKLFTINTPPLRDMRFNVRIKSKAPFRIRSNIIRATTKPDLRLVGTGQVPFLLGRIYVDTARLRLPAGTIRMTNGLVQFLETEPDHPNLEFVGTSRMLGYDITMLVEGPYNDPTVTLSSSPPLSNEDLLLLVLTGTPPPSDERTIDSGKRNLNVAVYIGRDLIARWFSGDEDSSTESILERFEAEIGREVSLKGEETIEAQFRLTDGIFLENDTLYITGEKDVFDYYNAGLRIVFRFK